MMIEPTPARNEVSIHAPARGATLTKDETGALPVFQSTRPRGARHAAGNGRPLRRCFNPRAREGRDLSSSRGRAESGVSIHAPARGATPTVETLVMLQKFQSTRPRGARLITEHL